MEFDTATSISGGTVISNHVLLERRQIIDFSHRRSDRDGVIAELDRRQNVCGMEWRERILSFFEMLQLTVGAKSNGTPSRHIFNPTIFHEETA
jgi:hypothetical protein